MKTVDYWINHLNLQPHPEGGFFKETYRSSEKISSLPERFEGTRNFSTAIYFLLRSEDRSVFHRIKSDELWHFYQGSTLSIYVLTDEGMTIHKLGSNPEQGESLQVVIPANCWFGAKVESLNEFALCGCTVAPGFDFQDFEMADRNELLKKYPGYEKEIIQLTRDN
jgi:predicted cupin superfamily sugar epimerase